MSDATASVPEAPLKERVAKARGKFLSMASAYALGAFNDNFFKQAGMLMMVQAGMTDKQALAIIFFMLPFLIFASYAGWLADRYAKRNVIIGAKVLEVTAMLAGAAGIFYGSLPLIYIMLFIIGTQACIFSPALNGSIPELYPAEYVTQANAKVKLAVNVMILAGIILAGVCLVNKNSVEHPGETVAQVEGAFGEPTMGRLYIAITVVGVALCGLGLSLGVPKFPSANPTAPFPWAGPVETLKTLYGLRRDKLLFVSIFGCSFIWFLAVVQVTLINSIGGIRQFALPEDQISMLLVPQMVGLGIGGVVSGFLAKGPRWHRVLAPACFGLALCMGAVHFVIEAPEGLRVSIFMTLVGCVGFFGGLIMVPVESFIQIRPAPEDKGKVIAAANFAAYLGMCIAGGVFKALDLLPAPLDAFALSGAFALVAGVALMLLLPKAAAADSNRV